MSESGKKKGDLKKVTKATGLVKNRNDAQSVQTLKRENFLTIPQGALKYFAYILSFCPPCGFLLGIIYYSQTEVDAKHFGRQCIIIAGVGIIGLCFCWGMAGLMRGLVNNTPSGLVGGYF